jgi:Protein of unknown function (DUF2938)
MNYLLYAAILGVGATALMDVWGIVRKRVFGVAAPNYALVGRWLAWMPRRRFRHESIAATPAVRNERLIGWIAHYLIGIAFAGLLLSVCGLKWIREPTVTPALMVGVGAVVAPFLLMQPGMGMGVAARRTPRPTAARVQSLITHAVFGVGLYGTGWIAKLVHAY